MAVDCTSNLSISLDAPLAAIVERGHGAHITPGDIPWAWSHINTTADKRGYFLAALQSEPGWRTTTAGVGYVRKRLADFTYVGGGAVSAGVNWDECQRYAADDWWLYALSPTSPAIVTAGTTWTSGAAGQLAANPHLHLEAWFHGAHASSDAILQIDWGTVWRVILYGNQTATLSELVDGEYVDRAYGTIFRGNDALNGPVMLRVSPMFHRCIYLWGTGGTEILWEDEDRPDSVNATDPDATSPMVPSGTLTITPYRRCLLQLTEVAFADSGTLQGTTKIPYAPKTGTTIDFTNLDGDSLHRTDAPTGTTCDIAAKDSTGVGFEADGTKSDLPLRVTLTGKADRRRTPVFYAAGYRVAVTTAPRVVVPAAVVNYTLPTSSLQVDEDRATLTLDLKEQSALAGKLNRAVVVKLGDDEEFTGLTSNPRLDLKDPVQPLTIVVDDDRKRLNQLLPGTEAYDGGKLTSAIKSVLSYLSYKDTDWAIQESDFRLPKKAANQNSGAGSGSQPLVQPSRGTRAGEYIDYLLETYSNGWRCVRQPVSGVVKWVVGDADWIAAQSSTAVTLYSTMDAAITAGKDWRYVVRDWQEETLEPEANDFLVIGQDPGGQPITSVYTDTASADPNLAEADRPANWIGEPRRYIYVDPSLCTQELCTSAVWWLYERGGHAVKLASFTCEWHPQLHREAEVTIDGDVYRVKSYTVHFEREADWGGKWRPCDYSVEKVL